MVYVNIRTGERFSGKIPKVITLPEKDFNFKDKNIRVTKANETRKGDAAWPEALTRWMFHQGFVPKNELEDS